MWYTGTMRIKAIAATTVLAASFLVATPPEVTAQPTVQVSGTVVSEPTAQKVTVRKKRATRASRAARVAKRYLGVPYKYGGSTPRGFDCSGYVQYVYKKVGKTLPRRASLQRKAVKYTRHPRVGDLVFFHRYGRVYHVGIYAGKGHVWHAPRPGKRVKRERIWTRSVSYGRV